MKKKALCSKVMAVVMAASLMVTSTELVSAGEIQEFQDGTVEVETYAEEIDDSEQSDLNTEEAAVSEDGQEEVEILNEEDSETNLEVLSPEDDSAVTEDIDQENTQGDFGDESKKSESE